ncbi:MAG: helix-turn-helix transcriptional regulator [Tissierellia bacterium]|nr:helix-turn-helix transcriptional regulator [Tissierellia bacterium]
MKIGDRIKKKRIELGYSVDELASKIGKNRATIYRYESHEIENLPTTVLEPLAKALSTTPAYLMGWDDEEPTPPEETPEELTEEAVILAREANDLSNVQLEAIRAMIKAFKEQQDK